MKFRTTLYVLPLLCSVIAVPLAAQQFNEDAWGHNTPGVELQATEGPREATASGTRLTYVLSGKGFPANLNYSFWGWIPGRKPERAIDGVTFNAKGLMICNSTSSSCRGEGPDAPIKIQTTAVPGEPKRFAVVSADGKVAGFTEVVPFPIEATNKNCKLTVIRQSPLAEKVLVSATGFVPYEMLDISANLGGEDTVHSPTAAADGSWQAVVGTQALGKDTGTASIKISGQQCTVSVSFAWGEGSAKVQ